MSCQRHDLIQFEKSVDNYCFQYEEQESHFGPERYDRHGGTTMITGNAARERTRVKTLRGAFLELQRTLPAVPPDTKLSKLDVLVLATTYIAHLMRTLNENEDENQLFAAHGIMHPVKKWPMRSRLYAGILSSTYPGCKETPRNREVPWQRQIFCSDDTQQGTISRDACSRRYSENRISVDHQNH